MTREFDIQESFESPQFSQYELSCVETTESKRPFDASKEIPKRHVISQEDSMLLKKSVGSAKHSSKFPHHRYGESLETGRTSSRRTQDKTIFDEMMDGFVDRIFGNRSPADNVTAFEILASKTYATDVYNDTSHYEADDIFDPTAKIKEVRFASGTKYQCNNIPSPEPFCGNPCCFSQKVLPRSTVRTYRRHQQGGSASTASSSSIFDEGTKISGPKERYLRFETGRKYIGALKKGKMDGWGKYVYPSGSIYDGEWKDCKRNGMGKFLFLDGDVYLGNFINGKRAGLGSYTYFDGGEYRGHFENNLREGKGIFHFTNGDVYKGDYKNDTRAGKGTYYSRNGNIFKGRWNMTKDKVQDHFDGLKGLRFKGSGEIIRNTVQVCTQQLMGRSLKKDGKMGSFSSNMNWASNCMAQAVSIIVDMAHL